MAVVAPATKRPDTEEAFGRMVAAELRKFPDNAILYRTKRWLMLVLFEAAEGQSSAVFTPHHRSAPYVRPQAGYAADTQPPATPHQPHHANAQLPPHPTYSLSPWLHVSQHGPSLAANQDPPGNSEDDSPSEDISLKFLQYLDYENGITAQASFESPYSLIYLLESFLHGVAVDPAACRVASLGSSVTRVEVVETS